MIRFMIHFSIEPWALERRLRRLFRFCLMQAGILIDSKGAQAPISSFAGAFLVLVLLCLLRLLSAMVSTRPANAFAFYPSIAFTFRIAVHV